MRPPEREIFPEVLAPGDPCSGDEALFEPGKYENFVRYGDGGLGPEEWAEAERQFHARTLAVLGGDAPYHDPELCRLAALLRLDPPVRHDTRPPRVAERALPDEVLADVVEDLLPDWPELTERVTGDDRRATVAILAVLAFVPIAEDGRRVLDRWDDDEDDRPLVLAARVIESSPPGVFVDGKPILPTPEARVPTGPAPSGACVARPYRVGEGWAWSSVVPLPRVPDADALTRRLTLELWRHRRVERRASWEDMLRARPEVLYRAACEGSR